MLFFGLELPDTIVYKRSTAFVDFNFTFLFIHIGRSSSHRFESTSLRSVVERAISFASAIVIFSFLVSIVLQWCSLGSA